jgi:membrane protease YdiL (CAAX protease family)
MSDLASFARNRWVFFLSRILILTGMVIFFGLGSYLIGIAACKYLLGVSITELTGIMNDPTNQQAIRAMKVFQLITSIGTFLVPAILFPLSLEQNPAFYLRIQRPGKGFNYFFALVLIVISTPFISWVYMLNQDLKFPAAYSDLETSIRSMEELNKKLMEIFIRTSDWGQYTVNLFFIALVPAITEEFFFRGCLQNFVSKCFYNEHLAIIFAALLFSGFHGEFFGFFPRFLMGVMLGYMYVFSGSIWVNISAHFLNNALALLAAFLGSQYPAIEMLKEDYMFPVWVSIASLLISIAMIFAMGKLRFKSLAVE